MLACTDDIEQVKRFGGACLSRTPSSGPRPTSRPGPPPPKAKSAWGPPPQPKGPLPWGYRCCSTCRFITYCRASRQYCRAASPKASSAGPEWKQGHGPGMWTPSNFRGPPPPIPGPAALAFGPTRGRNPPPPSEPSPTAPAASSVPSPPKTVYANPPPHKITATTPPKAKANTKPMPDFSITNVWGWVCTCGVINRMPTRHCEACVEPRTSSTTMLKATHWVCTACGEPNKLIRFTCLGCKGVRTARDELLRNPQPPADDSQGTPSRQASSQDGPATTTSKGGLHRSLLCRVWTHLQPVRPVRVRAGKHLPPGQLRRHRPLVQRTLRRRRRRPLRRQPLHTSSSQKNDICCWHQVAMSNAVLGSSLLRSGFSADARSADTGLGVDSTGRNSSSRGPPPRNNTTRRNLRREHSDFTGAYSSFPDRVRVRREEAEPGTETPEVEVPF